MVGPKNLEWRRVRLEEVVERVAYRHTPTSGTIERYVGADHVDEGNPRITRWGLTSDSTFPPTFRFRFEANTVLIHSRNIKKIAFADFRAVTGEKFFALAPKNLSELEAQYLLRVIQSERFTRFAEGQLVGSVNKFLNWGALKEYEFVLPPVEEQRKISDVLSLTQLLEESIIVAGHEVWRTRNVILGNWINGAEQDSNDSLDAVAEVNPPVNKLNENSPFVTMDAVPILDREPMYFEKRGSRGGSRAAANDVLFARITPCLENGKTCQVPETIEACGGSTELLVIRTRGGVPQDLIFHWATSDQIRSLAEGRMSGSTGRQRLGASDLGRLPFPNPNSFDAKELITKLNGLESLGKRLSEYLVTTQLLTRHLREDLLRDSNV